KKLNTERNGNGDTQKRPALTGNQRMRIARRHPLFFFLRVLLPLGGLLHRLADVAAYLIDDLLGLLADFPRRRGFGHLVATARERKSEGEYQPNSSTDRQGGSS